VGAHIYNTKDISIENQIEYMLSQTQRNGFGCLLECTGAPDVVNNCFRFLRKGGHAVLIGLPKAPLHIENVLGDFLFKAITVKTIHGRKMFSTWEKCEKLLAKDKDGKSIVNVDPIVSHEFPMSKFEDAFKVLLDGTASKIIMNPQL